MKVAALVLAADRSPGFEGCKYLTEFRDTTLIEFVVRQVRQWPIDEVIVVLGPQAERIVECVDFGSAMIVIDLEWDEGVAAPLRVGVDTIFRLEDFDTMVVTYADLPGISADDVGRLLAARRDGHRPAVVPKYRYASGYPLVVGDELWPRVMGMEGDVSLENLIQAHPDWAEEVWFDRLAPKRIGNADDVIDAVRMARHDGTTAQ